MPRFHVPPDQFRSDTPTLDENESHHCIDVLRQGIGDRITIFDGHGHAAAAEILTASRRAVSLRVLQRTKTPPPASRLTLAQAIPKGKSMDLIIEKAVELGAAAIAPLFSDRTVVHLDACEAAAKRAKWRTIALEACKQCGQNWQPEIAVPTPLRAFFQQNPPAGLRLIGSLQADAAPIKAALAAYAKEHGDPPREVTILIGPEGDFTPAEISLAISNGSRPITLGPITLRTETAAIYCLSVLGHELAAT